MTRRRWIADEISGNHAALIGEHARHLAQVLRARVGQEFDISTGSEVRCGRISSIQPNRVEFELGGPITHAAAGPQIAVALSIFKFDRMEWAIEKCTELGVARIIPVIAARTEAHLASVAQKRAERWQRIAQHAAQQCRRIAPPEISSPVKLKDLLAMNTPVRVVLSEVAKEVMLADAVPPGSESLVLAFGPEGGWKEQELASFKESGWTAASLGPTILRAETAAIAAVAVCQSVLHKDLS